MPLRDHFRPPLDDRRHWEGFHGQWPAMIVQALLDKLPERYFAEPRAHVGGGAEIDVATFQDNATEGNGKKSAQGGVATAIWAPPRPTFAVTTDLPAQDEYEVRVFDSKRSCRLVAAIEIVSPANKDRPEHRRAFAAKCAALLQNLVSVVLVDVVTTRAFNLYQELLDLIGQKDGSIRNEDLYAVACRTTKRGASWLLESWTHTLELGQELPTLPLWLADDLAIPLEVDETYEETCRILRIA